MTMHPLNTVKGAVTTAFILAAMISIGLSMWAGSSGIVQFPMLDRWLHLVSGVMWIGLLYYFNVVQTPGLAAAAVDKGGPGGAGITKYVAPRALLWFRWSAVITWISGAYYLCSAYGDPAVFLKAFMLQPGFRTIGVGAWLGTVMLFNVWVFIWPNQKKALGLVAATEAEKAAAKKTAGMASRINFILSVPMLLCMGAQSHGLPF
jgi:uncharacterized membrane protein